MQTALTMAAITLVIALFFGLMPIKGSSFNDQKRLKSITAIASGIIIASALLVVVPEGFELASSEGHDEHGDDAIGGEVAIVLLEHGAGEIDAETAIEEIEVLFGDHEEHGEEEEHSESEEGEESLSEEIMHVIEEVEDGDIDAATGLAEIETLILEHGHEEEEHEETPVAVYGLAILLGFLLMLLLEASGAGHAVHEEHHDHTEEHGHAHVHHHKVGWTLVAGLSLHAAADGLAIGAAIASGESALTSAVIAAVLIHKAPAAFSLGVFSMHERENESQSIKDVVLFSVATPLALIVSYLALADIESATIGLVMLFSAGSFLYVATVDTLPDIHNPETGRATVVPMLMGIALVGILLLLASQMGWLDHGH
jgi:zinc transporter 9|tara:strand:- start:1886 stop:2995 length:1110 start_codon:yes stop_codon:yes gene_type:complete